MVGSWTGQPNLGKVATSHLKVKASSENKSFPSSQVFLRVGFSIPATLEPPSRRTRFLLWAFIVPFLVYGSEAVQSLPHQATDPSRLTFTAGDPASTAQAAIGMPIPPNTPASHPVAGLMGSPLFLFRIPPLGFSLLCPHQGHSLPGSVT